MRTSVFAMLLAVMLALFGANQANARVRIPIVIPIPGSSEKLVKVKDLPDIPLLRRKDGRYIDLGYKFNRFSGGEWVGYIGSSKRYLPLSKDGLKMLMLIGGLHKLPPVPERPGMFSGSSGTFWVIIIAIFVFFGMVKRLLSFLLAPLSLLKNRPRKTARNGHDAGLDEQAAMRAQMRIEEMARAQGAQPAPQPAMPAAQSAPAAAAMMRDQAGRFDTSGRAYGLAARPPAQPTPAAPAPGFGQAGGAGPAFGQRRV